MEDKKTDGQGLQVGLGDILFPFLIPVKGMVWIGATLKRAAEEELTDESKIQERLLDLQMRFEMDEMTEEEYDRREGKLMQNLEAIRKYKEERT